MNVPVVQLGDLVWAHYGKALKQEDRDPTGSAVVYGSSGEVGRHCEALTLEPTIVVGRKGSVGAITFAPNGGWVIDTAYFLERKNPDELDLRYLFHALRCVDLAKDTITTSIPGLNRDDLLANGIRVPKIDEQRHIAAILDKADSLRHKRQEAIRLADEFLRAVFIDMFGDPGSNPKNFEAGTIRDLVASANYGTSEKASEEVGKYAILRMNNITYQGGWDFSSLKYVDLEPATAHKFLTQRGDLLFNRTNSKELVGKTAVYMRDDPMAIAGYLVRVRMNERGNPHYVSGYLNSAHGKQTLTSRAKSIVGMANINAQEMQDIPLLLPPKELQDKFGRIVEEVTRRASKHQAFAQQADELQAALANQFFCTETGSL